MTISDLRDQPQFFETVADRIWRAWWKPQGHDLDEIRTGLTEMLSGKLLPFALVAHEGDAYLGSALGIQSDIVDLPQYSSWVAAVWVEPEHRLRQVGRTIVGGAVEVHFARGFRQVYLCSPVERRNFYTRQGWVPIAENVGGGAKIVYVRKAE